MPLCHCFPQRNGLFQTAYNEDSPEQMGNQFLIPWLRRYKIQRSADDSIMLYGLSGTSSQNPGPPGKKSPINGILTSECFQQARGFLRCFDERAQKL